MTKALLLLVIVVFMAVGALIMHVGSSDEESTDILPSHKQPQDTRLSDAERDSYVNTVQTIKLQARQAVKDLDQKYQDFVADIRATTDDVPRRAEVDKHMEKRLSETHSTLAREFDERLRKMKAELNKQIEVSSLSSHQSTGNAGGSAVGSESGIPDGFGFDGLATSLAPAGEGGQKTAIRLSTGWSTVVPMRSASGSGETKEGLLDLYTANLRGKPSPSSSSISSAAQKKSKRNKDKTKSQEADDRIPAYTIPRNATLFSNDTMSALLGVIPVEGSVLDPIRFKVITGNTNMATNGLFIPGVRNIVWSGIATGNREMSCVRGELYSVTFTFEDGTIRTISSSKNTSGTKSGARNILAYISNRQGNPCLKGLYISNAEDYLRDRIITAGAAGAAEGFSATQQTTVSRADGSLQTYFSGKTGDLIASRMASGGLRELTDYLRERNRNAVDLVFLEAGQEVVLHVEQQIEIDYEINGRKLEYANSFPFSSSMAGTGYRLD